MKILKKKISVLLSEFIDDNTDFKADPASLGVYIGKSKKKKN